MSEKLAETLAECLISPNETDSNMEPANIVDVVAKLSRSARAIANAITPVDVMEIRTANGVVSSLTEAVLEVSASLNRIADAINNLADGR